MKNVVRWLNEEEQRKLICWIGKDGYKPESCTVIELEGWTSYNITISKEAFHKMKNLNNAKALFRCILKVPHNSKIFIKIE